MCTGWADWISVGEGELVVGTEKQRPAKFRFQRRDALPQRLPRQKQPLCGPGIIHFFAQYQKVVQLADVHGFLLRMFVINKEYRLFRQL